jgi:uncharacterized damage-inducible protein DinB
MRSSPIMTDIDLRFPIGKFHRPTAPLSADDRAALIAQIAEAPARLRVAVKDLDEAQLGTPYRDGGWSVRQVVHHLPDSHLNAYTRFKLGLTEDLPTIRPFEEDRWAELPDARTTPIGVSLVLLDALHKRWVAMLEAMQPEDFERQVNHPVNGPMTLATLLALYAWHGRHHVAHITSLAERQGWSLTLPS